MHQPHIHPLLAQLRSTELGRTADIAHRPDAAPRVIEVPQALVPVERDPFLDGLGADRA